MQVITYDDITGTGVKAQLITLLKVGGVAVSQSSWISKWYQAVMLTATGTSRIGNSTISSTNGIPIGAPNNGQFAPPIAQAADFYDLSEVYVLIKSGDVMSFSRCAG
jgi:hypothetical protein